MEAVGEVQEGVVVMHRAIAMRKIHQPKKQKQVVDPFLTIGPVPVRTSSYRYIDQKFTLRELLREAHFPKFEPAASSRKMLTL